MQLQGGSMHTTTQMPNVYGDLEHQGGKQTVASFDATVRAGFVRKVYAILSLQLLLTAGIASIFTFHQPTHDFVLSTPSLFYAAMFLPIGFIFALMCYKDKHPHNMYILGGFTLSEAYTIGVICTMLTDGGMGKIVLQAVMLTAATFIAITVYTFVTKKDFSFLGAGLFGALWVLIAFGLLSAFFPLGSGFRMIFALGGSILFAGYILYDTSQIMHNLGPDDYIEGAINLYLDIINLFLYLLEFLRMLQGGSD